MKRSALFAGFAALAALAIGAVTLTACGQKEGGSGSDKLAVTVAPDDMTLGNPKAKVQVVEYAAPMCPHCAHFNETVFPTLKKDYIDTGKIFYVFRVMPIGEADVPAESLARCVPKSQYFAFIDLLFRKQELWDPEYQVPSPQAGLVQLATMAGLSEDKALACMQDQKEKDRIDAVAKYGADTYGIDSTPSFIINGTLYKTLGDTDTLKKILDPLVSKK